MLSFTHKIADCRDKQVNNQADGNREFLRPSFSASLPKRNGEWRGNELHHQQGTNQRDSAKATRGADDSSHGDNGADAVGVDEEGQHEPSQAFELADVSKSREKASKSDLDYVFADFVFVGFGRGSLTYLKTGIEKTAHQIATLAMLRRIISWVTSSAGVFGISLGPRKIIATLMASNNPPPM